MTFQNKITVTGHLAFEMIRTGGINTINLVSTWQAPHALQLQQELYHQNKFRVQAPRNLTNSEFSAQLLEDYNIVKQISNEFKKVITLHSQCDAHKLEVAMLYRRTQMQMTKQLTL